MRAVVLILAAACGFAPQESFTGRRIGDGVAPWQNVGALELCLGNERVGPEASVVGGFCVDVNKPPETPCLADADCGSREGCVCGRCTVRYCNVTGECDADHACFFAESRCLPKCRANEDCRGAGEFCAGGICRASCGSDAECQYGEFCSSQGRCRASACSRTADCQPDEACREQRIPRATAQPSALSIADEVVLYLEMADVAGIRRQIWRATSRDGRQFGFDPAAPVVDDGAAPSAVEISGGVRLYFETAAGITMADSVDGIAFGSPSFLFGGDYHAPGAVVTPTGAVLLYVAEGDRGGLAVWDGAGSPRPVLAMSQVTDPDMWRDVVKLGSPCALVETSPAGEPAIHVWFDAFGQESKDSIQFGMPVEIPPNDSVGFASTLVGEPDRLVRYSWNPVFDRVQAFLVHLGERAPAVVRLRATETYLLYYEATSADGSQQEGIGVARNPPE